MSREAIESAQRKFAAILEDQFKRVEAMKRGASFTDYAALEQVVIGVCWGDGIGEFISKNAEEVLAHVLKDELRKGKIVLRDIKGLTIENRVKHNKAIPDDVLEELKACHIILKGPTTTPQAGDPWPNIESANVAMRRA
ncbi:MAG: isocitrate/isopropylmalate dehydrogenase family protein, partial [Candidatus Omnitrophica bacterium]|nr:isocitrate/isopropylmalate dehydrogenase family protein [Candidatus Omnitrophota bacterium]